MHQDSEEPCMSQEKGWAGVDTDGVAWGGTVKVLIKGV